METVEVDGSHGEGGGQILRTAAAFSIIQGRPVRVTKIRSGREAPGLRQQHLSALEILREMSRGRLDGGHIGSTEVTFIPGNAESRELSFDLKTAASITLVLQAVVPAAALSGLGLRLHLRGGTDVPWSPTFDYFEGVVRPAFSRIGLRFTVNASRRGYYPRGGGRVDVEVQPTKSPDPLVMTETPGKSPATVVSRCGDLPKHVAERQLDAAVSTLKAGAVALARALATVEDSDSPGTSILIQRETPAAIVGADAIGARGKRAEAVGAEAASRFLSVSESGACVDSNLADMLAPILALARGESRLRIQQASLHLETSLYVANLFTGCQWRIEQQGRSCILAISP